MKSIEIDNCEVRREQDALIVELMYPNVPGNPIKAIELSLSSVRANDGLRISYDFDRDGWSIQQPVRGDGGWVVEWKETSFAQAWEFDDSANEEEVEP